MNVFGLFDQTDGKTQLSADERAGLLPSLATREELNQWERSNILEAYAWAFAPANLARQDRSPEAYVRSLHRRMFDQTWTWAGRYRGAEKNIGIRITRSATPWRGVLGRCSLLARAAPTRRRDCHPFPSSPGVHPPVRKRKRAPCALDR